MMHVQSITALFSKIVVHAFFCEKYRGCNDEKVISFRDIKEKIFVLKKMLKRFSITLYKHFEKLFQFLSK